MNNNKDNLLLPLIAVFVLLADVFTKFLVSNSLALGESRDLGWIAVTYVKNTGVAFSLFQNMAWLPITVSIIALSLIIYFYEYYDSPIKKAGVGLLVGGIIGNLIDRISLSAVVDIIDIKVWPVFNIADICITAGVIILLIELIRQEKN